MKGFSKSLIIREMQIKTTMRDHPIPAIIRQTTNVGENVKRREPFCPIGKNINWFPFISFSALIDVAKTSKTMLNSSGESGHPCLVPDFRGNAFNFSPMCYFSI